MRNLVLASIILLSGCSTFPTYLEAFAPKTHRLFYGDGKYECPPDRVCKTAASNSYIQTPNAYGPGIHMDQYGRAVKVGENANSYVQTPNAYGPGIHMDQYGQPVRVSPY